MKNEGKAILSLTIISVATSDTVVVKIIKINDYVEGVILMKENDTMEDEVSAYKVMSLRVLS